MARLKLAYGLKENIEESIDSGKIPPGTLILTQDSNEIYFYDINGVLGTYEEKHKFSTREEAESWIQRYNCRGEVITIHENDQCNAYIVDYENNLLKFSTSATPFTQTQADWEEDDPTSPAYIKNKPDIVSGNDRHYVHSQLSPSIQWDVIHSLQKFPAVTVVDSAGNDVVGDIKYISENRLQVIFTGPFSGTCYCN